MLKKLVLATFFFFPLIVFAQITFEKGYFIDHNGNKVECLIKNMDWKNNPSQIEYRLSENSESKTINTSSIREFGINTTSKYVNTAVKIDRSSDQYDSLGNISSPVWLSEQLPLKVLVEGKASLYIYQNGNLVRFFYKVNEQAVQQLIYKKYLTPDNNIGINAQFRRQLLVDVNCRQSAHSTRTLAYSTSSLVKYFNKYNECSGGTTTDLSPKRGGSLNLKLKTAIEFSSYRLAAFSGPDRYELGTQTNYRFGLEAEYVLPSNKNKWSLLADPGYQHYSGTKDDKSATYKSIEVPIGVRHYFFLGSKAKLFLNGLLVLDFPVESKANLYGAFVPFEPEISGSVAFGGGFGYGRFSVEFRDYLPREAAGPYGSKYWKTSFLLGIRLF